MATNDWHDNVLTKLRADFSVQHEAIIYEEWQFFEREAYAAFSTAEQLTHQLKTSLNSQTKEASLMMNDLLERRRHEATAPSRRHNESNSDRARSQDSSYNDVERGASLRSRNNDYDSNGGRGGDIGPCDLEREAAASRSSIVVRRSSRSRRPPSTTESTRSRVEWWEKKRGYDVDHQQARQSPVIPALRNRMNAAGDASSETRNNRDTDTSDNNERSVETRRSRSSPRYQPSASSQRVRSRGASSHGMQTRDSLRGY
ncbi:hypothetical protein Tcan_12841 [Toxocara canis]|uniref:Uncharacterized protein n=1 Tax=Toxocara canis TaxID=6265 RepID=A0A0B2UTN6_TOXCA|nr:hypothetical protein Tcan_12841 [Toxocara canis]